jgi:hypothetical protein
MIPRQSLDVRRGMASDANTSRKRGTPHMGKMVPRRLQAFMLWLPIMDNACKILLIQIDLQHHLSVI